MDFSQNQSSYYQDQVPLGAIITKYIQDLEEAEKVGNWEVYVRLVQGLDRFMVQYKDKQYDKEIREIPDAKIDAKGRLTFSNSPKHAQSDLQMVFGLYRILVRMIQRSGFTPIRVYEGEMTIDMGKEAAIKDAPDSD